MGDLDGQLLLFEEKGKKREKLKVEYFSEEEIKEIFKKIKKSDEQVDLFGEEVVSTSLQEKFIIPPFSVLNQRSGYWQRRRLAWLTLGVDSGKGRSDNVLGMSKGFKMGIRSEEGRGKDLSYPFGKTFKHKTSGTSIFDPVLCELMYRWFCPEKGRIFDPFAGGSVRGIVAEYLGYKYTGMELRQEQIDANEEQAKEIGLKPIWITGDSRYLDMYVTGAFDFIFSSPPFYLEKYSDLPEDLDNAKTYKSFLRAYRLIVKKSVGLLKDNRFACYQVGDVRDKKGAYRGLVSDTIKAFEDVGMVFYNDAVLMNPIGTACSRASRYFPRGRKLAKVHSNVLIFYKGNIKKIKEIFNKVCTDVVFNL